MLTIILNCGKIKDELVTQTVVYMYCTFQTFVCITELKTAHILTLTTSDCITQDICQYLKIKYIKNV